MNAASDLRAQAEQVSANNDVAQAASAEMEAMWEKLPTLEREAQRLQEWFPATADQSSVYSQVRAAASNAGVPESGVSGLTVSVPVAIGTTGAPGSTASTTVTPPPGGTTVPGAGQQIAGVGGAATRLAEMKVDVVVSGSRGQLVSFLSELENMGRAFLVSTANLSGADNNYQLTVSGVMYMMPDFVSPKKGGEPVAPSPEGSPETPSPTAPAPAPGTGMETARPDGISLGTG